MGVMIEGEWFADKYETDLDQTKTPIQSINDPILLEPGRYHLYASKACPFAHRALMVMALKGLYDSISVSFVENVRIESDGWHFSKDPGSDCYDSENGLSFLRDLYATSIDGYTGRVSVPLLWDKVEKKIVNAESSSIMKSFNDFPSNSQLDLYPPEYRSEIDTVSNFIEGRINYGVYMTGFCFDQSGYEKNVEALFEALDEMEEKLTRNKYLLGDRLTIADLRLFATLVRFDDVYHYHFKCSKKKISEYPNLKRLLEEILSFDEITERFNINLVKEHYFKTHKMLNCKTPDLI